METTITLAQQRDILRLASRIKDNWTLAMFMSRHKRACEAETMIAQTIHACRLNHNEGRGLFSFKGKGVNAYGGGGLVDNPTAYATLIRIGYFVEDQHEGRTVIRPTQKLVSALDGFLSQ